MTNVFALIAFPWIDMRPCGHALRKHKLWLSALIDGSKAVTILWDAQGGLIEALQSPTKLRDKKSCLKPTESVAL